MTTPSNVPQLLGCLRCRQVFLAQWRQEKRPVFETVEAMRQAGRKRQEKVGERWEWVMQALCEDCRNH